MVQKKFAVLLFTGHVGSSWLASLISSQPEITRIGFEPVDEFTKLNKDFGAAIDRIAKTESTDFLSEPERQAISKRHQKYSGETFTGDKLWFFLKTRSYLVKQERFFRIILPRYGKIIFLLRRRNKIKNAISQFKRTQLGISHLNQFEGVQQKRASIKVDTEYILKQAQILFAAKLSRNEFSENTAMFLRLPVSNFFTRICWRNRGRQMHAITYLMRWSCHRTRCFQNIKK